jgi:hypothetical protein
VNFLPSFGETMAQEWYVTLNGQQTGPLGAEQLKQMAASGQLQPTDMIWKQGMQNWVPAKSLKGLSFGGAPAPAPLPAPVPAGDYGITSQGSASSGDYAGPSYDATLSKNFRFDGQAGDFFVVYLLAMLLSIVTCYFGLPWAVCMVQRWSAEHTIVQGRRLKFTGNGGDLFIKWIIWYLLTAVTCGIYMFWMVPNFIRWITEHTDFADA